MTSLQIRESINAKKLEVRGFLDASDAMKAKSANEELRGLKESLAIAVELEEEEKRELQEQEKLSKANKENNKNERGNDKMAVNEMRAIAKILMNKEVTQEERAAITTTSVGTVIPKQFVNQIIELSKGYGSLKDICDVIPVVKSSGTIPVVDISGQNALLTVAEGDVIVEGAMVTTDVPFAVSKVGLLQKLTSETIDDAEVEIETLVKKNFVEISTANENAKILAVVKTNAVAVSPTATTYDDICTVIDGALPSIKAGLMTITNVSGYCYLKGLKDTTGRKLDLITMVNGVEYFYGKPIINVEDTLLPATATKKVFYVLNSKEAIKYMDRNQFTVARSTEAGFKDDSVVLRILKRFGVVLGNARSIKKIEF